jgi:hypothetical protein
MAFQSCGRDVLAAPARRRGTRCDPLLVSRRRKAQQYAGSITARSSSILGKLCICPERKLAGVAGRLRHEARPVAGVFYASHGAARNALVSCETALPVHVTVPQDASHRFSPISAQTILQTSCTGKAPHHFLGQGRGRTAGNPAVSKACP